MTERYEKDFHDAMYEIEAEAMSDSREELSTTSISEEAIGDEVVSDVYKQKKEVLLQKLLDVNLTEAEIDELLRGYRKETAYCESVR